LGPEKALKKLGVNTHGLHKFPLGIGNDKDGLQHFMLITEYKWKHNTYRNRDALTDFSDTYETDRFFESTNAFAFYLPKGSLKTQYSAAHGPVEFGFFGALLNSESSDILTRLQSQLPDTVASDQNMFSKAWDFWKTIGNTGIDELRPNIEKYDFNTKFGFNIGEAVGGVIMGKDKSSAVASLSMRKSGNPYTTLVFSGVKDRRQHAFSFDFLPRNRNESAQINEIIRKLKRGMLPGLKRSGDKRTEKITIEKPILHSYDRVVEPSNSELDSASLASTSTYKTIEKTISTGSSTGNILSSAFFDYPNVYKIGIYKRDGNKNEYLHQIGQSSMLNLKVTYGNDSGVQSFFKDTGAPTRVKLDLTFKENFGLTRNFVKQLEGA
jgi:hypothetical protein